MKPIAAVVESQHDQILAAVRAGVRALAEAESEEASAAKRHEVATTRAQDRRIALGRSLVAARGLWPSAKDAQGGARGPGGRTWAAFLESVGITLSTAWHYMRLAQHIDLEPRAPRPCPTYAELGLDKRPRGTRATDDAVAVSPDRDTDQLGTYADVVDAAAAFVDDQTGGNLDRLRRALKAAGR